jgi:hypothetical protein
MRTLPQIFLPHAVTDSGSGLVALQKRATSGAIPHARRAEASVLGTYGSRQTFF